ncbi:hypothetical protein FPQ18DRAFT_361617 [Pyronema domesticum]|nr:hypothetical protein FPQ18DRAFT_361617 [Pyronema domesticum]
MRAALCLSTLSSLSLCDITTLLVHPVYFPTSRHLITRLLANKDSPTPKPKMPRPIRPRAQHRHTLHPSLQARAVHPSLSRPTTRKPRSPVSSVGFLPRPIEDS